MYCLCLPLYISFAPVCQVTRKADVLAQKVFHASNIENTIPSAKPKPWFQFIHVHIYFISTSPSILICVPIKIHEPPSSSPSCSTCHPPPFSSNVHAGAYYFFELLFLRRLFFGCCFGRATTTTRRFLNRHHGRVQGNDTRM